MKKRVITGAAFAIVILGCIALQGWVLRLMILFAGVVAIGEMYRAYEHAGALPMRWCGYAYSGIVFCLYALRALFPDQLSARVFPIPAGLVAGILLVSAVIISHGRIDYERWEKTILPILYPGLFFSLMYGFTELPGWFVRATALLLAFFMASINDVFAMLIGLRFGKHRFSGEISPKKSVEGSIAGLVASILFAIAIPALLNAIAAAKPALNPDGAILPPLWAFALLGLVGGMASQLGDLVASLIKRHVNIKDYGTIFPGHGGMMDRMDGILFCAAVCLAFFHLAGY